MPKLDVFLEEHLAGGQVILCAGPTGSGKTVLAGQLATHFTLKGENVLFISKEVEYPELFKRTISARSSIAYSTIMDRMDCLQHPMFPELGFGMAHPDTYGRGAAAKSLEFLLAWARHLTFLKIDSLGYNPERELGSILGDYQNEKSRQPDVIVYDYLDYPRVGFKDEINAYKMRQAVIEAAKAFKRVAREHNILVVMFCQADPGLTGSKKISPRGIAEFRSIYGDADAFIGISAWRKSDDDETAERGVYRKAQYLTVTSKTHPTEKMVPVERVFKLQRFEEALSHPPPSENEDPSEVDHRANVIAKSSEFPGYVLARWKVFSEIVACGVPYAMNLYALLLLVSGIERPKLGKSFYSREKLGSLLGLSVKQIRIATDLLINCQRIDVPLGRSRQSLEYEVSDWKDIQNPGNKGYFKLFRNLRDACRTDLLGDPVLFRVWLYLLGETRLFPNEDLELDAGDVFVRPRVAAEKLKLTDREFTIQIDKLETRGSVQRHQGVGERLKVVNWDLYQNRVCPSTGHFEAGPKT